MKKRLKLLFFGASEGGVQMLGRLGKRETVIGFVDNDVAKQGSELKGIRIYSPTEIHGLGFDYIVVSSMHYEAIEKQLIESGVNREKILTPPRLIACEAFPLDGLIYLLLLLGFGALITYIPLSLLW